MEGSVLTPFLNEWLGLIIDVTLIIGVFCLWFIWYRNGKRQQKLEQLLLDTAQQLEEATMHLSLATSAIEQVQQQAKSAQAPVPSQFSNQAPAQAVMQEPAPRMPITPPPAQGVSAQRLPPQNLPPQNSTQATMILRMQREGESEESIADRLDIPLAQVKLMLKLHAASHSASI